MERGNVRWRTYGGPWEIRIIFSTNVNDYIVYFYVLLTLLMKQVWVVIERTVQFSCDNHPPDILKKGLKF